MIFAKDFFWAFVVALVISKARLFLFLPHNSISDGEDNNCRVSEEGTGKIVNCAFPFKIGGKMFYNCTHDFDPDGKFWCSTKTNSSTSEHVPGNNFWGFCEEKLCPGICAE